MLIVFPWYVYSLTIFKLTRLCYLMHDSCLHCTKMVLIIFTYTDSVFRHVEYAIYSKTPLTGTLPVRFLNHIVLLP